MSEWYLLFTGSRTAAENIALDELLLELKSSNSIPNIIRFLQFSQPAVLIGYHQILEDEARIDFCIQNNIELNRRITGGGAIYVDSNQLGWEVIAQKSIPQIPSSLPMLYKKMCNAVIEGLKLIGVNAVFSGRNDIEVNGRKISGTGGTELGDAILFQGTLLIDIDIECMLKALKIPAVKLKSHEIRSVKDRITSLKTVLGYTPSLNKLIKIIKNGFEKVFSIETKPMNIEPILKSQVATIYNQKVMRMKSDYWVYRRKQIHTNKILSASKKTAGGLINATLCISKNIVKDIVISGDFFVTPRTAVFEIEKSVRNTHIHTLADEYTVRKKISKIFDTSVNAHHLSANDFSDVILTAVHKHDVAKMLELNYEDANKINIVNKKFTDFFKPSALLLPYCAKHASCEYRYKDECTKCGKCDIGYAYELANKNGIACFTVLNFNHFIETLQKLEALGVNEYIGCCCRAFFTKHLDEICSRKQAGIFIDIDSKTCYELGLQTYSYEGTFEFQTRLNLKLLDTVISYFSKLNVQKNATKI